MCIEYNTRDECCLSFSYKSNIIDWGVSYCHFSCGQGIVWRFKIKIDLYIYQLGIALNLYVNLVDLKLLSLLH